MFGLFRKKRATAADALVAQIYGRQSPKSTAELEVAAFLAFEELLHRQVRREELLDLGRKLLTGPVPYSTYDLAVALGRVVI